MRAYTYELVGGHPVLDFLNTVNDWKAPDRVDRLTDFGDAVGFAVASGVLRPVEARQLGGVGDARELEQLRALREMLARVVQSLIASAPPYAADLAELAAAGAIAAAGVTLKRSGKRLSRTVDAASSGAMAIRLRLVDAALELLTSETIAAVKSCPSCGWFFLDTTRNRSRRWCSMSMCGAPIKSRRYYYRRRRGEGRGP